MAKIRLVALGSATKYVVEYGEDFQVFDSMTQAILYCMRDLGLDCEVVA